ncbi:hypothetical protein EHP00_208 [Ecytonucleospora hepatopenaei]|uniref:Fungal lipase-type domain-containing protein n=1 Tax=Ecytonucleospora hepatopenaei TaxID=646526 RepID=A0A1W0E6H3_9MICR|nr:hypothetical protein EHP00_208 [Ecytonucleospora hepatopenaei]
MLIVWILSCIAFYQLTLKNLTDENEGKKKIWKLTDSSNLWQRRFIKDETPNIVIIRFIEFKDIEKNFVLNLKTGRFWNREYCELNVNIKFPGCKVTVKSSNSDNKWIGKFEEKHRKYTLSYMAKFIVELNKYTKEFDKRSFIRENSTEISEINDKFMDKLNENQNILSLASKFLDIFALLKDKKIGKRNIIILLFKFKAAYEKEIVFNAKWRSEYAKINKTSDIATALTYVKYARAAYSTKMHHTENAYVLPTTKGKKEMDTKICKTINCKSNDILLAKSSGDKNIGFILVKKDENEVVLAFKGTSTFDEVTNDIDIDYVNFKNINLFTSNGFASYTTNFLKKDLPLVLIHLEKYKKVTVVGHSLGGAIASLVNVFFIEKKICKDQELKCYTFGSAPSIGEDYAKKHEITNQLNLIYELDIVPQMHQGSVIFIKYLMRSFIKAKNNPSVLSHIQQKRKVQNEETWTNKIYNLTLPGLLYRIIFINNVYLYKQIKQEELYEIKITSMSFANHSLSNLGYVNDSINGISLK